MREEPKTEREARIAGKIVYINAGEIRSHLDEMVLRSVEDTLNALLDAEAGRLCSVQRFDRSADRVDTRAGIYKHKLHSKAVVEKIRAMEKLPEAAKCVEEGAGKYAALHGLSVGALEEPADQQSLGAPDEGDLEVNLGGGSISKCQKRLDASGGEVGACGGDGMGWASLHGHGTIDRVRPGETDGQESGMRGKGVKSSPRGGGIGQLRWPWKAPTSMSRCLCIT